MDLVELYFGVALGLMAVGLYCIGSKRNMLKTIIGIEVVTSGINLNIIVMGLVRSPSGTFVEALAQSYAIISITVGACVAAVALTILINAYKHYGTLDLRKVSRLRW